MSNLVTSSIGKKLMMSLAGLFLCVFMVVHLGINLLLLLKDRSYYDAAVEFMGTNPLIKIMEVFLFGGFILHMIYGVVLQIQNKLARPVGYAKTNHSQTSFFSKYMIHTGAIIAAFLVLHLINFYFVKLGWVSVPVGAKDKHDFYTMCQMLFQQPLYSWIYIVAILFLGFHLNHALQSAFQTLGWDHVKYTPIIKAIGFIYSVVITVGFIIIPVYFLYFFN